MTRLVDSKSLFAVVDVVWRDALNPLSYQCCFAAIQEFWTLMGVAEADDQASKPLGDLDYYLISPSPSGVSIGHK